MVRQLVITIAVIAIICSSASAQVIRAWSDASGDFKIYGKFVSLDDGEVTIVKADGSKVSIELTRLSKADQAYVKEQIDKASKPVEDRPVIPPAGHLPAATDGPIIPNVLSVKVVKPSATTSDQWKIKVAPQSLLEQKPQPIALGGLAAERGIARVIINPRCQRAVVVSHHLNGVSEISVCDLSSGKIIETFPTRPSLWPLAISDGGYRLALSQGSTIHLWDLTNDGAVEKTQFIPYAPRTRNGSADSVTWATFLDEDRLLTASSQGTLVNWTLTSMKPKWVFQCDYNQQPTITHDLKTLACVAGNSVFLIDVTYGRVITSQRIPVQGGRATLKFSPTGEKLALAAAGKLIIVKSSDGSLLKSTLNEDRPELPYFDEISWIDDDHILNRETLIDLETFSEIWTYYSDATTTYGGYAMFGTSHQTDKQAMLVAHQLPHVEAIEYRKKIEEHPELFAYCKGKTIQLDLAAITDGAKRTDVEKQITAQLRRSGVTTAASSDLKLIASVEPPKPQKIRVIEWGTNFYLSKAPEFTFNVVTARLKLRWKDRTLWEASSSNDPQGHFEAKGKETVEQTVRRYEADIYGRLPKIRFPLAIPRPDSGLPARDFTSQIRPSGIHDP